MDRALGMSVLTQEHADQVREAVNWAIGEAIKANTDPTTGKVTATRFHVLIKAVRILADFRDSDPAIASDLTYRDADHYLAGRISEWSIHVKKDARGIPIIDKDCHPLVEQEEPLAPVLSPAVIEGYELVKELGFWKQMALGGNHPAQYNPAVPPSRVGGSEWGLLGYKHLREIDAGHERELVQVSSASGLAEYQGVPIFLGPVRLAELQELLQ
jgi:hypothetical protein